jgi:hypothetical protein
MMMKKGTRYKALFLLIVFSLNTVLGFACSVGINMGYNKKHHNHEKTHSASAGLVDNHEHHHTAPSKNANETDSNNDCCANEVTKFIQLDKFVPDNNLLLQVPVFFLTSAPLFNLTTKDFKGAVNSRFQFVRRSCSLNDTDIRIAIQSFQI